MITARGVLKTNAADGRQVTSEVTWRDGVLIGDLLATTLLEMRAAIHAGDMIMWHGRVQDWLADPVAYGILLLEIFENDTLDIVADETMAPPPCPDGAVC
jgi:hypothetical protein